MKKHLRLIRRDLLLKHERMAESAFSFLRATFYRWVQVWPKICPDLAAAPNVLAAGDLHIENFGTWRDSEGRLIWGINDFDEAYPMSYTNDLVRLAASVQLAIKEEALSLSNKVACNAILAGYTEGLTTNGAPFVLSEQHSSLRKMAVNRLRDPRQFWQKLESFRTVQTGLPGHVRSFLERSLPERGLSYRVVHREAGMGSLGRQRFTAIAEWRGGKVAREAKALTASACLWQSPEKSRSIPLYPKFWVARFAWLTRLSNFTTAGW